MSFGTGTVFVLGAGFTKAFIAKAPLLVDKYDVRGWLGSLGKGLSSHAERVLESELKSRTGGRVNLERLMTRLSGRMPYDRRLVGESELPLMLEKLTDGFLVLLNKAMDATPRNEDLLVLERFARHCVREKTDCITFNYDDLLDKTLWLLNPVRGKDHGWNPDRGYGFACRPSHSVLHTPVGLNGPTDMSLLKLHGSINWYVPLGHPSPFEVDAIRHHSAWAQEIDVWFREAAPYLETKPFIVPPVLTKSELAQHPVLYFLWTRAFESLLNAERVVFIGYSLPLTDVAAGFLFREAWQGKSVDKVTVVGWAEPDKEATERQILLDSYGAVFAGIQPCQIELCGAVPWIDKHISGSP
jgi:hypothetical protein